MTGNLVHVARAKPVVLEMLSLSKVEGNKERREKRNKTEEILSR
jgi:hypothetical protein